MIPRRPLFAVAVMILAGLACNSSTDDGGGGNTPVADVLIVPGANTKGALAFDPNPFTVTLTAGSATVKWGSNDNVAPHRVRADGASPLFDSPQLRKGQTYSFTFTSTGTYTYHCFIHATMVGTIQVN